MCCLSASSSDSVSFRLNSLTLHVAQRPEVAADYIVTEKKDGRESSSLRSDSPDEKGNSMIDSRKKTGAPTLASALTAQNKVEFSYSSLILISSSVFFLLNSVF